MESTWIDQVREIVKTRTPAQIEGVGVPVEIAEVLVKCYDSLPGFLQRIADQGSMKRFASMIAKSMALMEMLSKECDDPSCPVHGVGAKQTMGRKPVEC